LPLSQFFGVLLKIDPPINAFQRGGSISFAMSARAGWTGLATGRSMPDRKRSCGYWDVEGVTMRFDVDTKLAGSRRGHGMGPVVIGFILGMQILALVIIFTMPG
jgi:hypothetical protein